MEQETCISQQPEWWRRNVRGSVGDRINLVHALDVLREVPNLPALWKTLAHDKEVSVRMEVAKSLSAPPETLAEMAWCENTSYVQSLLADNRNLPVEAMEHLLGFWDVNRTAVVTLLYNDNTPDWILRKIAELDCTDFMMAKLAKHPNISADTLDFLYGRVLQLTPDSPLRGAKAVVNIAMNPSAGVELLWKLLDFGVQKDFAFIRAALLLNPSLPEGILMFLLMDRNDEVRMKAEKLAASRRKSNPKTNKRFERGNGKIGDKGK